MEPAKGGESQHWKRGGGTTPLSSRASRLLTDVREIRWLLLECSTQLLPLLKDDIKHIEETLRRTSQVGFGDSRKDGHDVGGRLIREWFTNGRGLSHSDTEEIHRTIFTHVDCLVNRLADPQGLVAEYNQRCDALDIGDQDTGGLQAAAMTLSTINKAQAGSAAKSAELDGAADPNAGALEFFCMFAAGRKDLQLQTTEGSCTQGEQRDQDAGPGCKGP